MTVANSARLSFALMDESDAQLLFDLDQDSEVMRFINGGKPSTWQDIEQRFLPRLRAYRNAEKGWGLWKVTINETKQYIGWVLVRPMDFFSDTPRWDDIELGWRFKQEAWGKGFASEAAQQIQQALARQTGAKFYSAVADIDNLGSINIMKKIGMKYIKTEQEQTPAGEVDAVFYQMPA
ncbi:GNAT family N-acetyltransferase [Thalassotalea sp. 42_200_T64]|nr:GNAT family N-acetyltransferase [Thalassotalea sp. 42_200_T64]